MASGQESRRSGSTLLERGALGALKPSKWQPLCNVFGDGGKPTARVVRVSVARSAKESEDPANVRLPAGVWWTQGASVPWVGEGTSRCNGALRFSFGSQGASRILVCDLASGEYVIPSCEHLYVEATRYTPGTDAAAVAALGLDQATEVTAEITDGSADGGSPMLVTAPSTWGVGGVNASALVSAPKGAYAFELFADSPLGTANAFELSPPGALRNFAAGLYQPSGPLPVLSSSITVQARGAAPVAAQLVFWVR